MSLEKIKQTKAILQSVFFHEPIYVNSVLASFASKSHLCLLGYKGSGKTHLLESLLKTVDPEITAIQQGYLSAEFEEIFARPSIPELLKGEEEVKWKKMVLARCKGFDEIQRMGVGALSAMFRLLTTGTVQYMDQEMGVDPFWCILTANPQEGSEDTLNIVLPEPLWDRFNSLWVSIAPLKYQIKINGNVDKAKRAIRPVWSESEVLELWRECEAVTISKELDYIMTLINRVLGFCLPKGETVLTVDGFKPIEQVRLNDEIVGSDGEIANVEELTFRQYNGKLVSIKGRGLFAKQVTGDHPILIIRRSEMLKHKRQFRKWHPSEKLKLRMDKARILREKGFSWKKIAEKIGCNIGSVRNYIYYSRHPKKLLTRNRKYDFKKVWAKASKLHLGDYLVIPKIKIRATQQKVKIVPYKNTGKNKALFKEHILDESWASLFGWYVAEGYCEEKWGHITFYLHPNEREYANQIIDAVKKATGLKARSKVVNTARRVICGSRPLARFLKKEFGFKAIEKKIPNWLVYSEPKVTKAFLSSLFKGDGHIKLGRNEQRVISKLNFSTSSKDVLDKTFIMLNRLGVMPSVRLQSKGGETKIEGRVVKTHKSWVLSIYGKQLEKIIPQYNHPVAPKDLQRWFYKDETCFYVPIKKLEGKDYEGLVYNIETSANTYIIPFIVHNCQHAQDYDASSLDEAKKRQLCSKCSSAFICSRIARPASVRAKLSLERLSKGFAYIRGSDKVELGDVEKAFPLVYWRRLTLMNEDEVADRLKAMRGLYKMVRKDILEVQDAIKLIESLKKRYDEAEYAQVKEYVNSKAWFVEVLADLEDYYDETGRKLRAKAREAKAVNNLTLLAKISRLAHAKFPPDLAKSFVFEGKTEIKLTSENQAKLASVDRNLFEKARNAKRDGLEKLTLEGEDVVKWLLK